MEAEFKSKTTASSTRFTDNHLLLIDCACSCSNRLLNFSNCLPFETNLGSLFSDTIGLLTNELCSPLVFLDDTVKLSGRTCDREGEALHGKGMKFVNV
jgi:hypothetical protein